MASYGTRLGLAYLVKYPQHVQRIILDGNIAPSNELTSLIGARAFGAVTTFNAFFQYCADAGNKCILNNLISATQTKSATNLISIFDQLLLTAHQSQGIPTSSEYANRPVTSGMIANLLYTEMAPSSWKVLALALYQAEKSNSGDELMKIYMANTGYNPASDTFSTDNNATSPAVICEDYVIPDFNKKTIWIKFIDQIHSRYSQIGTVSTLWLTPICINWQVKSTPLLPSPSKVPSSNTVTSPQVFIIGNSKDPMTPFENALAVKKYLSKFNIRATVLKWNGLSHTALLTDSPQSACVFGNVDKFLLDKQLPIFIECNDWQNPFIESESD